MSEKMVHVRRRRADEIAAEEDRWTKEISEKQVLLLEEAFAAYDSVTPIEQELNDLSMSVEMEESAIRAWFVRRRNNNKKEEEMKEEKQEKTSTAAALGDESEGDDEIIVITEGEEKSEEKNEEKSEQKVEEVD